MLSGISSLFRCNSKKLLEIMKKSGGKNARNSTPKTGKSKVSKVSNKSFTPTVLPPPVQSASDKKQYKVIQLENGLIACLISDTSSSPASYDDSSSEDESDIESEDSGEETEGSGNDSDVKSDNEVDHVPMKKVPEVEQKMAAASLSVRVGSFSDPRHVQGLAHFLEHMVFMGSAKYPKENGFDKFIKNKGGWNNGSTDFETTSFEFECLDKHLEKALDRFAQFFIAPLMKKSAMTRERESIDDEFKKACIKDENRKDQLLCSIANPDSPVNQFSWGNSKTLQENISDDHLYAEVHKFRKKHYSAHRMKLAIQARLPLEELEKYTIEYFSQIKNNEEDGEDFTKFIGSVFNTPEFNRIYYVKPQKDMCQLDLTWCLPPMLDKYRTKPNRFISWLISDEGKGSLLSHLKKKVWALKLYTDIGHGGLENNSMYSLFGMSIVLTSEGWAHLSDVITDVYSYIKMLRNEKCLERLFRELQTIEDVSFKFAVEEDPLEYVETIADAMQYFMSEDYITGADLLFEYDPKGIQAVLEHLSPDNMNVIVFSNNNEIVYDKKEEWFGTLYAEKEIPSEWMEKWKNVSLDPDLYLPPPNPFLTSDFTILPKDAVHPDYPEKIVENELFELWYRKDQKFNLPKAQYNFYLISPFSVESASSKCKIDFLLSLFLVQIQESIYPALIAELSLSAYVSDEGIVFKFSGYNEKLPILVRLICELFKSFHSQLTPELFAAVKEKMRDNYFNKLLKPSTISTNLRLSILMDKYFTPLDKYVSIMDVEFDDMKQFAIDFQKTLYLKVLIQGNVDKITAINVTKNFVDFLKYEPLKKELIPKFRVSEVPKGEKCCRVQAVRQNDSNSIVTNYYQVGPYNMRDSMIIELCMMIIEEPLFDTLRTKEQLSYHVECNSRNTFGILGYSISVRPQATKHSTEFVDGRIENFVKMMSKTLKKMSEKKFNQVKRDLIKTKQCSDTVLQDEINRNWAEIQDGYYRFDRNKQEIKMIETIKITDVRKFWESHNVSDRNEHRKLSLQVVGDADCVDSEQMDDDSDSNNGVRRVPEITFLGSNERVNHPHDYFILDFSEFKRSLPLYPMEMK